MSSSATVLPVHEDRVDITGVVPPQAATTQRTTMPPDKLAMSRGKRKRRITPDE